ncbi:MAG: peptidyl-prolyl cis-trans isomerase [Acidobacteriota bacterium]
MAPSLRRFWRQPTVHFMVLGSLVFAFEEAVSRSADAHPTLEFSAPRVEQLASDFASQMGRPPSDLQLIDLVEQAIREELLEREARRLQLGYGDRGIRHRLLSKMRAVTTDLSLSEEQLLAEARRLGLDDDVIVRRHLRHKMRLLLRRAPPTSWSEAQLAAALERHRQRFEQPATVSFAQVFVSALGAAGERRANELRAQLTGQALTPDAAQFNTIQIISDPFPLGTRFNHRSHAEIVVQLGGEVAEQAMELAPEQWSQPVASRFGWHLLWVHDRRPAGLPGVDEVREPLTRLLAEEQAARQLQQAIDGLRQSYRITVDWPEPRLAQLAAARETLANPEVTS